MLAVLGVALWAAAALASWMVPPSPYRAKDFTLVKKDGIYHVFYIRNNPNLPLSQTQLDFGHATSPDLYFWQQQDSVLEVRPGFFDQAHVWAPSIVQRDSVYYMFYAGVADTPGVYSLYQRMGLATSTDLYTWNRLDLPILGCDQVPWSQCDSLTATPFRDPFVMPDPTQAGRWLMVYCTAPASSPTTMVAALATSDGDFTQWQDLEPLWITQSTYTFSDLIESPHMFVHNGLWFLFFTTNSGQPLMYCTSPDPVGQLSEWSVGERLATMLGVNTSAWFASEYFRDGLVEYFTYVDGDRVEINHMVWTDSTHFALIQPDLFHVQSLAWTSAAVRDSQLDTLNIQSVWWSQQTADLEALWLDSSGGLHPVANSILGIPDHIPLTADVTPYTWLALPLPDSLGAPTQPSIILRMKDQTATASPVQILASGKGIGPGIDPTPLPIVGGGTNTGGGDGQTIGPDPQPVLRNLRQGVFGIQPSLLVDLPSSQPARLDVFDLQGRRVRTLADRRLPKGATVLAWDGRDQAGGRLPRGLYFARLVTPRFTLTTRILLR